MEVNDYQIGGKHYQRAYQHWDFVIDTNLHYLYGCATKYIARWRQKNGIEDLRKAAHYLSKAISSGIEPPPHSRTREYTAKFVSDLPVEEKGIILDIMSNDVTSALYRIQILIRCEEAAEPDSRYTNQD